MFMTLFRCLWYMNIMSSLVLDVSCRSKNHSQVTSQKVHKHIYILFNKGSLNKKLKKSLSLNMKRGGLRFRTKSISRSRKCSLLSLLVSRSKPTALVPKCCCAMSICKQNSVFLIYTKG